MVHYFTLIHFSKIHIMLFTCQFLKSTDEKYQIHICVQLIVSLYNVHSSTSAIFDDEKLLYFDVPLVYFL